MARKISPLMMLPPAIFGLFAIMAFVGLGREGKDDLPSTRIGQPAPAITTDALGNYPPVTAEMLNSGDVTLVNFWASWCPPCRAEHPRLMQLKADGVKIIGVNFKDKAEQGIQFLEETGNPFSAVAFDPKGRTAIDWGVTAPPETFIIDKQGNVVYRFAGPLIGGNFDNRFEPELKKAQAQ